MPMDKVGLQTSIDKQEKIKKVSLKLDKKKDKVILQWKTITYHGMLWPSVKGMLVCHLDDPLYGSPISKAP